MGKQSFDVFCPECNILIEAQIIAEGSGGFRSNAVNPVDMEDAEYYGENYSVCLCPRCTQVFLVRESLYGIPGEFETVTEQNVLYPNTAKLPIEMLPKTIQKSYEQALKSFSASLFEPCTFMCRKCLELVCKHLNANGHNLYNRLEALKNSEQIDARMLVWAHEIRLIGNEAAHDLEGEITKVDAKDVLDFTEAILIYIFSLTERFESFQSRRKTD